MVKKHKHKWKYQINVKKKVIVLVILGVSLFVGLGYAILETNLGIFGTLQVSKVDRTLYGVMQKEYVRGNAVKYSGNHQDSMDSSKSTEDIYHFYANRNSAANNILEKMNVVYAGQCWKMIRTTDTGGVRLMYNGTPETSVENGVVKYNCGDTRNYFAMGEAKEELRLYQTYMFGKNYTATTNGEQTTFTLVDDPNDPDDTYTVTFNSSNAEDQINYVAENYPYTCYNTTGTCTTYLYTGSTRGNFYKIDSYSKSDYAYAYKSTFREAIGIGQYKDTSIVGASPSIVGYMYDGNTPTTSTFELNGKRNFVTSNKNLTTTNNSIYSTTLTLGTTYYYADTYDWNVLNPDMYTLTSPTQIDSTTDYSSLAGKYVIKDDIKGATVYYIIGIYSTNRAYVKSLSGGDTDVSMRFADDITGNTLDNPTTPVELKDYYNNYSSYKKKYTCGDSSVTCSKPRFIYSNSSTSYNYIGGYLVIGKDRSGLTVTDYVTLKPKEWFSNYNSYTEYNYTCGTDSATCAQDQLYYIIGRANTYFRGVHVIDITIAKSVNGLNLDDYITIDSAKWYQGYDTTYKDYKYTCDDTSTTCTANSIRYIYNKNITSYDYYKNYYFGKSVKYENNMYKLQDVVGVGAPVDEDVISTHHYFCLSIATTECASVGYYYYNNGTYFFYTLINDPSITSIDTVMENMFEKNDTDSQAKKVIDDWYERKIKNTIYESKVDDTIYCNKRTYDDTSGWNPNGGSVNKILNFTENQNDTDISCTNVTDRFSVSNNDAKLKYPVALMTVQELNLLGVTQMRKASCAYWTMSPYRYFNYSGYSSAGNLADVYQISTVGTPTTSYVSYASNGHPVSYRPAISLKKDTTYIRGTGSTTDPYVVDSDVRINKWTNTQLSGTSVTASSITTTISTIGSTSNGNDLSTIEYYTTCSSGTGTGSLNNPETATIRNNNAATITFNACPGAILHYRIKDSANNYSDDWNHISDIAQYALYAEVYNYMTYAGGVASNDERNLSFWVNNTGYNNTAHRLISMAYYDEDSEATVEALDTTTLVERAYPTFFGREPDSTKTTWINALDGGTETIESFFLEFINSTEAKNIRSSWGLDNSEYHP